MLPQNPICLDGHTNELQSASSGGSAASFERRPTKTLENAPPPHRQRGSPDASKRISTSIAPSFDLVFTNAGYYESISDQNVSERRKRFGPRYAFVFFRHLRRDRNRDNTH
ncbi:hypothetical protein RBWH47_00089 [Rhodopirellula baltica WH47]|uniref:Uncharacterized protein n=1 Tax=Rhodopirellula baltica WH47 TaxID=991778 RepID=F2B0I9_RHOBT|nr:hypothetical protein RBWH47_00089 [Rhodopirellula baltica WH47]